LNVKLCSFPYSSLLHPRQYSGQLGQASSQAWDTGGRPNRTSLLGSCSHHFASIQKQVSGRAGQSPKAQHSSTEGHALTASSTSTAVTKACEGVRNAEEGNTLKINRQDQRFSPTHICTAQVRGRRHLISRVPLDFISFQNHDASNYLCHILCW
ncbi:hypothetical protein U0070_021836, partial [Myodes glareolus]